MKQKIGAVLLFIARHMGSLVIGAVIALVYLGNYPHHPLPEVPKLTDVVTQGIIAQVESNHAQEISQLRDENTSLREQNNKLEVRMKTLEYAIKQTQREMADLKKVEPYPIILSAVKAETVKPGGLQRETTRILGDVLDVSRIHFVQ